jgi:hypothetical protein
MPVVLNLTARGRRRAGARTLRTGAPVRKIIQAPGRIIGSAAGWLVGRLK